MAQCLIKHREKFTVKTYCACVRLFFLCMLRSIQEVDLAVTALLCIRKMLASNLGRDLGYDGFLCFLHSTDMQMRCHDLKDHSENFK